ncbi:RNA polymerase sigma factor [Conexibacter woesei]|uniref:Putative RNA polymerase, sigma-24 subunit, ECF subfamily n=1 Tax=Conexibacter woesei (strain DSM 14684 / CCUG 47730 / CIP 108061 / JCM 11494 / NBRC 100937 / ID131577) TaxID=469383 RepID=D3F7D8_CONWI|nr:sigma-70 family RNA polymerase sigma factor [Conexibacter woesei]ADB48909.1 putative RNA polymerase, sigma-24 subunit, ECF subfamily [Conexibacter woesei DSM 14684]
MIPAAEPRDELADTVRVEGARILATLVRTVGSLQVAEDAVQEAVVAALRSWPRTGVPAEPRAWLTVTARNRAIDILRRERARAGKEREATELARLRTPELPPESVVRDDQLRLIFTCCHPTLSPEARVALALRTLCGLSPAQIAAVLLSSEAAIAKRLTRTRGKIAAARIPYRVPSDEELPGRLAAVCGVVHALYTAGHAPLEGEAAVDVDGCTEALRLARLLHDLLPDEAMPAAVLALLLLTDSRRPARVDDAGEVVLLADQDRARWDAAAIAEGCALLDASLRRTGGVADPYQLQAAIAAEHARAPAYAQTDWLEIVRLYDLLLSVAPSAPAALSRAVAVAEASGTAAALAALDAIEPSPRWHAVRAELLACEGRYAEAVAEITTSLTETVTAPERRHRERRRAIWAARVR